MVSSKSNNKEHKNDTKSTAKKCVRQPKFKPETVIEAIRDTGGIVTQIAAKLHCGRRTVYGYIERWKEVRDAYEDETNKNLDIAEEGLLSLVYAQNLDAIRYYLERKGLQRGYGGRNNIFKHNSRQEKTALQKVFEDVDVLADGRKLPMLTALIMSAVTSGELDPDTAQQLTSLVSQHAKILEVSSLEERIRALEVKTAG